jgi:hypothetical protein
MTSIVTVNVNQIVAPTPSGLQQTGAFISQGGTNLASGSYSLLTQLSDLTPLLASGITLTSLSWATGIATATLPTVAASSGTYNGTTGLVTLTLGTALSGLAPGAQVTVSGATGTGSDASINGTFTAGAGSGGTTLTYTIATGLTMTITGATGVQLDLALSIGATFITTIAGATPSAYNGTYLATVATASTFTYALTSDGGTSPATGTITFTPSSAAELTAMATTFFAQGAQQAAYVLELGAGTATAGVAALTAFITASPGFFYSYLVPRSWDANAAFLAFLPNYDSTTAKTYFFVTTTTSNYTNYTALMKNVYSMVEAPSIPLTEFSIASAFQVRLRQRPSSTNKVPPFAFSYLYGVTPYPTKGNAALLQTLKNAYVNVVGTGAEGGISNAILLWGTSMDGRDGIYWYSVDYAQIQADLNISNALINGSNDSINPLYYNQQGIDRLQNVVASTMGSAITVGLANGTVITTKLTGAQFVQALDAGTFSDQIVVNAVPFIPYLQANPGDYKIGAYDGLSVVYIPNRGFISILFNLTVTDFAASA